MARSYPPTKDSELLAFSANFRRVIAADAATYGLTDTIVGNFTAVQQKFSEAYERHIEPTTRGPAATLAKNDAKEKLLSSLRPLCKVAGNYPGVTPEERQALGLPEPDRTPTPVPPPSSAPIVEVLSVAGHLATVRLGSVDSERRRKPTGVRGANVFTHVGEAPPSTADGWHFHGTMTKTEFPLSLGASLEPGATVWITAQWFNTKGQTGPAATPTSTRVNFGGTRLAA